MKAELAKALMEDREWLLGDHWDVTPEVDHTQLMQVASDMDLAAALLSKEDRDNGGG